MNFVPPGEIRDPRPCLSARPRRDREFRDYATEVAAWRRDPEAYWGEAARGLDWVTHPEASFRCRADGRADWFPGGVLNTSTNALDRHVATGRGAQTALIWDSAASGE